MVLNQMLTSLESERLDPRMYRQQGSDVLVCLWSILSSGWPGENLYKLQAASLWVLSQFAIMDITPVIKKEIIHFGLQPVLDLLTNSRPHLQSDALGMPASYLVFSFLSRASRSLNVWR